MERIIIGLTGSLCSGKDTIAKYLVEHGFHQLVLSDRIRDEIRSRGQEITRTLLQDVGNELRETFGGAVLMERTAQLFEDLEGNIVIDGVRNPAEVNYLNNILNGSVLGVNAPRDKRLEWYLKRAAERGEDGTTPEDFKKHDDRDFGLGESKLGQHVGMCLDMADFLLYNDGSKEKLIRNCDYYLKYILHIDPEIHRLGKEK